MTIQVSSYTAYQPSQMAGYPSVIVADIEGGDGSWAAIPCDLENADYQVFLAWVAAGNTAPEGWTGPTNPT